jgi:hypothetical protein
MTVVGCRRDNIAAGSGALLARLDGPSGRRGHVPPRTSVPTYWTLSPRVVRCWILIAPSRSRQDEGNATGRGLSLAHPRLDARRLHVEAVELCVDAREGVTDVSLVAISRRSV